MLLANASRRCLGPHITAQRPCASIVGWRTERQNRIRQQYPNRFNPNGDELLSIVLENLRLLKVG